MTDAAPLTDQQLAEHYQLLDAIQAEHDERPKTFRANYDLHALRLLPLAQALRAHIAAAHAEIDQLTTELAEGVAAQTMLKGLNVRNGVVELEIEPAREMLLILVASMREMLDDAGAENYVALDLQDGQHPEDSYTVTVQRRYRPTAHELRERAEAARDQARAELATAREQIRAIEQARVWRNEDGKDFLFADDIRAALGCPQRDAAAVSAPTN